MSTTQFLSQTIDFDEWEGSPSRAHNNGVSVITIVGTTAWSDVDGFIGFLFPVGQNIGGQIGAALAANHNFRVFDYAVEGFGGLQATLPNGLNSYALAKWTIKCHVPRGQLPELSQPYNNDPIGLLEHEWTFGGQYLTIPSLSLKWNSDSKVPLQQVIGAKFIPTVEHSITWPRLQNPPFAAIRNAMSKINSSAFQLATGTIAAGQGLFLGARVRSEVLSDGTLVRTLTYKISERPLQASDGTALDWNYTHRDDSAVGGVVGWDKLKYAYNGTFLYDTVNFSTLFPNTF